MPASQDHLYADTPMGAQLAHDGATFRVWAPSARRVHLVSPLSGWTADAANELVRDAHGYWSGFWPGFTDGTPYKFWVEGEGSAGYKRDPYARELTRRPVFPHGDCLVRDPHRYPWRVTDFRPPAFHQLLIYQLHIGTFYSPQGGSQPGNFFDVISKIPYLRDLGFNAVQVLPIQEFPTTFSMGYNGVDYFSPENDYAIDDTAIPAVLPLVNQLLADRGLAPLNQADLAGAANQLRCLVDVFHAYGIAVIFDVVYNHAGGGFDDESIHFFDRQVTGDNNRSLYFTSQPDPSGGLCFALWQEPVRQFLIDNAKFLLQEYRIDGLRHDHVKVLVDHSAEHGWRFCQDLNSTCKYLRPDAVQNAEHWPVDPYVVKPAWAGGAAFDICYTDGLRDQLRGAIEQAARGAGAKINLTAVRDELWTRGLPESWRGLQNIETHDEVYLGRRPRIARLADSSNPRSWYARSRARVALGLLLTTPGTPMIFMGEEFLEDKNWADDLSFHADLRLFWAGLDAVDPSMRDFLRFTRELAWLRRQLPGLTGEGFHPFHVHDDDRILAFQRWIPGSGADVVIVLSLAETTYYEYRIGFPGPGRWAEVFNSDIYDHWVNPEGRGNGGAVYADGPAWQTLPNSAAVTIPANSVLIFAR